MRGLLLLPCVVGLAAAAGCPYTAGALSGRAVHDPHGPHEPYDPQAGQNANTVGETSPQFLSEFYLNDTDSYMTTDFGTPIQDQWTLKAGPRGPSLLEDFMFRQKLQRFDHERVPERVVHARGTGAHGTFTSYGNWSNITAASFLSAAGKKTPVFSRFSNVQGFRGSPDTVRDMHGFATKFYTDEGNFDLVGNTVPVFFITDAIQFPDLIHAVKPEPRNEIPQGGTAHDNAWDFLMQQPSAMHTVLWFMAGHGIPHTFRHVNGYGVHTFRLVTEAGASKLVKFHWKSLQGVASKVWEEAQVTAGKNIDYMRQDLYNNIAAGRYPEWELGVQIMDESQMLAFGFDLLDPTKIVPEEYVQITWLGKMQLNANPMNYFAETEQISMHPGHIVRGIDFSEDPLLQGRLYSYHDTQINRHGGPNFEQIPINRPRVPVHNNNRDGFSQQYIPLNNAPYSPNTLDNGSPMQANQSVGNGFFTAPSRSVGGHLVRQPSFTDFYSQARLFWNSLVPVEQQFVVNAIVFENSKVTNPTVRQNVITAMNLVDNDLAVRVAQGLGLAAPEPNPKYYHSNTTCCVGAFGKPLLSVAGMQVGFLASNAYPASIAQGMSMAASFAAAGVDLVVVAETWGNGVNATYSISDAINFDAVVVADGVEDLFSLGSFTNQPTDGKTARTRVSATSPLFPAGRPSQILVDAFKYGKPVGALGTGSEALTTFDISLTRPGVYVAESTNKTFVNEVLSGLHTFKFLDRFTLEP
ncbi:catalase-like domain-containing protein [Lipomyces orientalis]|uniref:Catalase-like domain-containing protein n=1 Tax=Lipomyces orientalis TaxID=1233043 RepID=A0ACC3TIR9_9ASCO